MVEKTPHQVLSPDKQEELDKEKIEEMLRKHNLDENIDLVYELVKSCANGEDIDTCIKAVIKEFEENQKEKEDKNPIDKYFK